MRTRITAMAGASLFATTGLLGAYVGYPGLRRAAAVTNCGTVDSQTSLNAALNKTALPTSDANWCDYIYIQPGTITLTADLPTVTQTSSVTITGAGEGRTIISGGNSHRAFYFDGIGDVSFSNLTIQNADLGTTAGPKGGSAIYSSTSIALSNVTLSDNRNRTGVGIGVGDGAAVWAGNGVVITASRFTGNSATQFGGAIYNKAGNITMTDSYIAYNDAVYDGGAIYNKAGDITITGSTFKYNGADSEGGAIFNANGAATISDSYFAYNTATDERGGAVLNRGSDVTITDSTFKTNEVPNGIGGALYINNGDVTIAGGTFESNSAVQAGAIKAKNGGVTVTSSAFTTNQATNMEGGAIYSDNGITTITGSTFTGNQAPGGVGGAIYANDDATIDSSTFTNNYADRGGGALEVNANVTITGGTFFTDNQTANNSGGAIEASGSVTITGGTFTRNQAPDGNAGAIRGSNVTITGGTFTDNKAYYSGGAVFSDGAVSITDSTFDGNIAGYGYSGPPSPGYSGGAVYVLDLSSAALDVVNSTFTDNEAFYKGSALYVRFDDGTGALSMNFSTVTGNTARTAGGAAVEADSSTDFDITNSILYDNRSGTPRSTPLDLKTNRNLELAFSLLTSKTTPTSFYAAGTTTTSNLLDGDPLLGELADNGGPTQTRMPAADSPVIGMADPTGAPAFDQRGAGFARTTDGLADMGAVQAASVAPEPDLSQLPPSWFQAQQRREQSATCPPGMVPSWAQWPNEQTGGWTCEWTTWWDVNKGSTGGWVTTPGFNPGLRRPE